jgi:LysW-gamma-L-lysine carboxypeptidase
MRELELLEGLLQHYSPTHAEGEAVAYLVNWMGSAGYTACVDGIGNAVGSRGDGPREVILLGHIDTVPGQIEIRREGDLLYGRGAVDAKGPLACFAWAAAQVEVPPGWRVTVIGAVGEEGHSRGARYILDKYHPDALVIGEPGRWNRVTLGYKGSVWFTYNLSLAQTHTAARSESACEAAVAFWNNLQDWCSTRNMGREGAFEQVTPTLRGMESGGDSFTETACLKIGVRLPPGLEPHALLGYIMEIKGVADLTMEDGATAAYRAEKNTPLVRAFLAAIRADGGTPSFTLKTGTSDMNLAAPIWKCQTLAYGPGDSSLDHTPDEHISIIEYQAGLKVLKGALERLMGEL